MNRRTFIRTINTMQVLFKNTKALQKLLRVVSSTNKLVNMTFTPRGIGVQAMTDTKTTLLQLTVGMTFFSHYQCEQSHILGISAPTLETLVRTAKPDEMVGFSFDQGKDILVVRIGAASGGATTEYQMNLIHIEEDGLDVPDVDFDVMVDVPSPIFHDWKAKTSLANGAVSFAFEQAMIRVSATSDEWGTVQVNHGTQYVVHKETRSTTISNAGMICLNILATCANQLRFGLAEDMPLHAEANMDETTRIRIYIAPMMVDD